MNLDIGPTEERLRQSVESLGAAHLTLLDPDSQSPQDAARMAFQAQEGGTSAIMVGGSVGASGFVLESTVKAIKDRVSLPVILFPGSSAGVCPGADAIFFMSLLNSRSTSYIIDNQALGAPLVRRYNIEPIPMAYLVVEPGGTVGWVGDARMIPRSKPEIAAAYALAGKYLGMRLVYLEAGSGAQSPVPLTMVAVVKKVIGNTLLIAGGGIKSGEDAAALAQAGADLIVTGTAVERSRDVTSFVREVSSSISRQS